MSQGVLFALFTICISLQLVFGQNETSSFSVSSQELNYESIFLSIPKPATAKQTFESFAGVPHIAGSSSDYATAEYTKLKFEEYGLQDVEIEELSVMLNTPDSRKISLLSPTTYVATLREDPIPSDPSSSNPNAIPPFHGYSASGNVTGQLIYANYGRLEDYQYLDSQNVSLQNRIVIVRYGRNFRGAKVMMAELRGAIGVLIYSDPQDDGFVRGQVYPDGPWRPETGIQGGSVEFLSQCPGDAGDLSRFYQMCVDNSSYVNTPAPTIPSHPLSWSDASHFIDALSSSSEQNETTVVMPDDWQGGIPEVTYSIGPGNAIVNLDLSMQVNYNAKLWNVCGRIPGSITVPPTPPDDSPSNDIELRAVPITPSNTTVNGSVILIGAHRDAWIYGAVDPVSGTVAMMEAARALGQLYTLHDWRPYRTIQFCSWDGEEYGLVGSTMFGESNANELMQTVAVYINADMTSYGPNFSVSATPSLNQLIKDITARIPNPTWPVQAKKQDETFTAEAITTVYDAWDKQIGQLGSGSDYTVFIQRLGIASVDFAFVGDYGVYHSIYDSIKWMESFGDPHFIYHQAAARFIGLFALRLADEVQLPLNYEVYGSELKNYRNELTTLLSQLVQNSSSIEEIEDHMELDSLDDAINAFHVAGQKLQSLITNLEYPLTSYEQYLVNSAMMMVERQFLTVSGLRTRPWYRHVIQAPGFYSGYAAETFPTVTQLFKEHKFMDEEVPMQVTLIVSGLNNATTYLQRIHDYLVAIESSDAIENRDENIYLVAVMTIGTSLAVYILVTIVGLIYHLGPVTLFNNLKELLFKPRYDVL